MSRDEALPQEPTKTHNTMNEERTLDDILMTLTTQQLDYVAVRMYAKTDKEAAEKLSVSENTVYSWPNKHDVNDAVRLAKLDGVNVAREKLKRLASKAVDTIDAAMGDKEKPGLPAALAVLDRVGMPEVKRMEATGKDGSPLFDPEVWKEKAARQLERAAQLEGLECADDPAQHQDT